MSLNMTEWRKDNQGNVAMLFSALQYLFLKEFRLINEPADFGTCQILQAF